MTKKAFGVLPSGEHVHLYEIHHSQWKQPVVKAGEQYHSETKYIFA